MRVWAYILVCLYLLGPTVGPLTAGDSPADMVRMDETAKKATARALEWLAHHQNHDGSWSDGQFQHNTAITAFTLLAFMSQGHLPDRGLYGPEVARGCRFLLAASQPSGFLVGSRQAGNQGMYCHAMATLALAELWGMTGDDRIKPVLEKAVHLIVGAQSDEGGWRYQPNRYAGADISVTIMQVMALRAAKNSGLMVPDATLKNAIKYIKRCYHADVGAFSYQPGSQPGFARTAAGMCVLQLTGHYDANEIAKSAAYLKRRSRQSRQYFWYGNYYAAHAMHQIGGNTWKDWYASIRGELLQHQSPDGSWSYRHEVGPAFQTSIAVIILSVPAGYLPIFES